MPNSSKEWTMNYSNDRSIISTETNRSFEPAKRKKSLLSLISVISIAGLILFELTAVILLKERLGQTWDTQKENQTMVRQIDKLRIGLRKPTEKQAAKQEASWIGVELTLLANYYKSIQYNISYDAIMQIRFTLNRLDSLAAQYWNQKQYIIEEKAIDFTPSKLHLSQQIQKR